MDAKWKDKARSMFFESGMNIVDIAEAVGVSRKSISTYLMTLHEYQTERERRKSENADKRIEYKRNWDRTNRVTITIESAPSTETMRREHELAVMELSHERYH